jgi:hypothetical protein
MRTLIRIASFTALLLLFSVATFAQSGNFIAIGPSVIRSSSFDPSPLERKDGGQSSVGLHLEAGVGLPRRFQLRALAEYSPNPLLHSIFTSDADTGARADSELHVRYELRHQFEAEGSVDPFLAAGADLMKQFFKPTPMCQGTPATFGGCGGRDSLSLNPTFTVGARIGEYTELSASRIFEGALNQAELAGYRANVSYHNHLKGPLSFKVGAEADYLYYRDTAPLYIASYYKRDFIVKFRFALMFGGRGKEYKPAPQPSERVPPEE